MKTLEPPKINKNSIFTIFPYKESSSWVFDDERVGLYKEALVAGADLLLDKICKENW